LTLAATTGPRQPRIAGTAKLVVFPLCVGPITTKDWAVSAARPVGRTTPGRTPRRRRPGGAPSAATLSGLRSRRRAQRAPRPPPRALRSILPRPVMEMAANSAPPRPSGSTTPGSPVTTALPRRHGSVGVDNAALGRAEPVLHQEGSLTDLPQSNAPPKLWEEIGFGGRKGQQLCRGLELAG